MSNGLQGAFALPLNLLVSTGGLYIPNLESSLDVHFTAICYFLMNRFKLIINFYHLP